MTRVWPLPPAAEGERGRAVVRPVSSPLPLPVGGVLAFFLVLPVVEPAVVVFLRAGTCLISCRHVLGVCASVIADARSPDSGSTLHPGLHRAVLRTPDSLRHFH